MFSSRFLRLKRTVTRFLAGRRIGSIILYIVNNTFQLRACVFIGILMADAIQTLKAMRVLRNISIAAKHFFPLRIL